jgi:hypothetical protein
MKLQGILILILIIICLIGGIGAVVTKLEIVTDERDQAISYNNSRGDSIDYLTNKLGQETARTFVQDLTIRNIYKMREDERLSWIKNFEGVNKRMSNLEQASRTTASIVAEFKMSLGDTTIINFQGDTTKARKFDNHDKWFSLKGIVLPDTIIAKLSLDVPLQSVIYLGKRTKKILFFRVGPRVRFFETTSANPYVKITKSEITQIKRK